jgi:hypothetical protein
MRNFLFAIALFFGLAACNDNANNSETPAGDSSSIENNLDTSSKDIQTDTMPMQTSDTTKVNTKKTSKKSK